MVFRRRSDTHGLTGDAYVLTGGARYTRFALLLVGVVVSLALVGGGVRYYLDYFASTSRVTALEGENRELRAALDKTRFDRDVEVATRGELERQLAAMNERLRQAEEELAFFKAATGRPNGR